jgi:hypothetical protein
MDRDPKTRILHRGLYSNGSERGKYECSGICEECEQLTPVSRDELLQAIHLWGEQSVHEVIAIGEYLNSLPDGELYDAPALVRGAPMALQMSEDRRASMEGLVMAAARVRLSDGSPNDMKEAARSVFIPCYERWGHRDKVNKEFSDKWKFF